jgi:glucose-6-phosphate 1-epimerase
MTLLQKDRFTTMIKPLLNMLHQRRPYMPYDIQHLNDQFSVGENLWFEAGPGNLPVAQIRNRHASASICLLGAHVLHFQPQGQEPILWVSAHSQFREGEAIRGGIPICWPWFGPHPSDSSKPSHGIVRTRLWTVLATRMMDDGRTEIELGIESNAETLELWPCSFRLRCLITVGSELQVELVTHNSGDESLTYTGALHSYFAVSDVRQIAIRGLEGRDYLDKTDDMQRKHQSGPIHIEALTDRIYLDTRDVCILDDPGSGRLIQVAKEGSNSTVVWNPWQEKAQTLSDFGADEYPEMVCIETAKAADDMATIPPGEEHRLKAVIGVV